MNVTSTTVQYFLIGNNLNTYHTTEEYSHFSCGEYLKGEMTEVYVLVPHFDHLCSYMKSDKKQKTCLSVMAKTTTNLTACPSSDIQAIW